MLVVIDARHHAYLEHYHLTQTAKRLPVFLGTHRKADTCVFGSLFLCKPAQTTRGTTNLLARPFFEALYTRADVFSTFRSNRKGKKSSLHSHASLLSSHLEIDASRHEVCADEDPNLTSSEALNDIITLVLQRCKEAEMFSRCQLWAKMCRP